MPNDCPEGGQHRWRTKKAGFLDDGIFGLVESLAFGPETYEECGKCFQRR